MKNKEKLLYKIDEAIASNKTSKKNRILLLDLRTEIDNVKTIEDLAPILNLMADIFGLYAVFKDVLSG